MSDTDDPWPADRGGRIDKKQLALLVGPILLLVVASNVGNALGPRLQDSHPLVLVALSPLIRWQLLVVNKLDWWTFFPSLRSGCSSPTRSSTSSDAGTATGQ